MKAKLMEKQDFCLLHKRTDCCTILVKTNEQLIERLKHLIIIDEMNSRYKKDGEEKQKLLKRIYENKIWLGSIE